MDLVEGRSLADMMRNENLSERDILLVIKDLLSAVGFAHSKGVVHRDLKPSNVLVDQTGRIKVTDFGLAIPLGDPEAPIDSRPGVGTPFYMAPEQVRGDKERIDARTDLYSIGVLLYEMLTSRLPYSGTTVKEVYRNILESEARPPRAHVGSISADVEGLCLRSIAREPADRFQSAAEMRSVVLRLLDEEDAPDPLLSSSSGSSRASIAAALAAAAAVPTKPVPGPSVEASPAPAPPKSPPDVPAAVAALPPSPPSAAVAEARPAPATPDPAPVVPAAAPAAPAPILSKPSVEVHAPAAPAPVPPPPAPAANPAFAHAPPPLVPIWVVAVAAALAFAFGVVVGAVLP